MEQSTVYEVLKWGLGLAVTGFFFLAGWCWLLKRDIGMNAVELEKRVTYKWIEDVFTKNCEARHKISDTKTATSLELLRIEISKLNAALIGTLETKGLITKIHEQDDRITTLENKIK